MIVDVWQRVMDLAKSGTSGQDTEDEFNGKANSAQKIIYENLIDFDEINQKVTDALSWLKKPSGALTSGAAGVITMPSDYLHLNTVAYIVPASGGTPAQRFQATKILTHAVEMTRSSPIRQPDLSINELGYYFKSGSMFVMPEQAGIQVDFMYFMVVPDATITLTPVSDADSDMVTPTIGTDFGWPISLFNLLVYTILEQFGIEMKERILYEYSQFGISREMIKTNPQ